MVGKRLKNIYEKVDLSKEYKFLDAFSVIKDSSSVKFDESVELIFNLNVDPKYQDQNIREVVQMPSGLGKEVKIAVFARDDKLQEAKDSGADFCDVDDLVSKIKSGVVEFDHCIATPDMMAVVGQLGKVLGPKGLMPNPKLGTVTTNVKKAIESAKSGQIEIKADKYGVVHAAIGKVSFSPEQIESNFLAVFNLVKQVKPTGVKGTYIKKVFLGSTMGPSLEIVHNI